MANKAFRFADRDVRQTSVWHLGEVFTDSSDLFSGVFSDVCKNRTADPPTNQPTNKPTNQPTNQSTNQPINQSTNQPINQPNNFATQPTNQSSLAAKPPRQGIPKGGVKKIILTGSGGTFRDMPLGTNVFFIAC